ncbi:MAG: hypothetical protein Q8L49_07010 [Burkholderiaceae bacterium]|nr:hypothetical protein [Burkholderiaceae bacterium]
MSAALPGLAFALPLALLAACATRSADVMPLAADPGVFAAWSCDALYDEADRVRQRAAQRAYAVDERSGNNIIALGLGVTVFWPALLAMRPNGPDAQALAQLRGQDDALRVALSWHACPPAPQQLAPARAAALPIALGERLVYEERAAAGGPARELGLRVAALHRDELEFAPDFAGRALPLRWQQDLWGNQPRLPEGSGWLHWKRLLQPDLALGDVISGDVIGGDGGGSGRLRGQVIALGVQTSLGRPFDAAVIELFGDVPMANHGTRLNGVMVVDRKSGVLLRLDLHSGNPEFALRRTLTRIEPAPP